MSVIDEILEDFERRRALVQLERDELDDRLIQLIPLAHSPDLLLAAYVNDFRMDGRLVLRRQDITDIWESDTDRFQRELLAGAGQLDGVDRGLPPDLSSFGAVVGGLGDAEILIFEDETLDPPGFWIGRPLRVDDGLIRLREFSGVGRWHDQETLIHEGDLTCLQIDCQYIRTYAGYLRNHPPPPIPASGPDAAPAPVKDD